METDTSDKKMPLEDMSKEDVIKKYNNLLLIAKKAKQSKNETLEEIKKAKERESKLLSEVDTLKEVIQSFTEKQKQYAEVENTVKQNNEKINELTTSLKKVEGNLAMKIVECKQFDEALIKQSEVLSEVKKKYADTLEKLEYFKETFAKVDIEKKLLEERLLHYEAESNKNENSNQKCAQAVLETKKLEEELNNKEKQLMNLTEKYAKLEEQYKNLPENWTELSVENKKLAKFLSNAEEAKAQLEDEVDFFRKSLVGFEEKSKECAKLSDKLLKEERENLKLMEEINEMKKANSEFEQLKEKLVVLEAENVKLIQRIDECTNTYNKDLKTIEKKLEIENEKLDAQIKEKDKLIHKQKHEFDVCVKSHEKKLELLEVEKQDLVKLLETEKLKAELDVNEKEKFDAICTAKANELNDCLQRENKLNMEKKELENLINKLNSEAINSVKEWEKLLAAEKEKYVKLLMENNELNKIISEKNSSENEDSKKRDNIGQEMEASNKLILEETKVPNENLKAIVTETDDVKTSVEDIKVSLQREKENSKQLMNELEHLKNELHKSELKVQQLETCQRLKIGIEDEKFKSVVDENRSLTQRIAEMETTNEENILLKNEIEKIKYSYTESVNLVRRKLEDLLSSFSKIKNLRNNFDSELKNKLKAFELEQTEVRQNIEEVVLKYVGQLHNGNSELLSEMNDMNQALKERGETISKLEQISENQRKELDEAMAKITIQTNKLNEKNKKLGEMEDEIGKVKLEVETKHKAMRELEEEMWKMKNNDSQGEALSSSTISRAEESARFMELEESFEERYTKLKVVAVKLKKKVTELQKQVETERNNLLTTEADYQSKITDFHNQIKSLRVIQSEYDKLQDDLDTEKKEKNSLKKSLVMAQEEISSYKQQLEEGKSEREKFKLDKSSFEKIKKELTAHILELKQTIEKQKKESSQLEKQMDEIRRQLSVKDRHVEEEREKHKAAILLLEEQKLDSKKHNVLELEMAAYERTAEDLKKRLDNREQHIKELENNLETERKTISQREEEINKLKLNISNEQIKTDGYNSHLKQLTDELNTQKLEVQKKCDLIKGLEKSLAEETSRVESLSSSIEEITKEKFGNEEKFRSNEEKFCRQIRNLEDNIQSLEDKMSQKEMELKELKSEYDAYKVRAQSVLRQSQKELTPSKQNNALEELEQLKSTSESLKSRLEESSKKLQKLLEENKTLQEEKKRFFGRVQELNSVVTELRNENHNLKEAKQKENEEHAEALRMQKLQSETLAQCFQKEIEDLEAKRSYQVEELKKQLEQMEKCSQIFFKPDVRRVDLPEKRKISTGFVPLKPEKEVLDVMLLEREECEGSESVDSMSPQNPSNSNLIPLEQLLAHSDLPDGRKQVMPDATQLKAKIEKNENRIRHLTVLLADAESDSARLTQLNDVLKEEIKRLQRSLEREKHAQNFEYLKNVIVKFVSLQNIDEKLRLIPVLNTILKLSPEEEATLTNCAKGIHETGHRSWGLNLGLWPTG
ncbi:hypothetical protein RUM44_003910 [Polyplax serrata]|uniref:GRIP domain-containing protein n=1 Tax=Polyplax serrata TaxID=468196 RepID=A0ABR1B1B7_POLSC